MCVHVSVECVYASVHVLVCVCVCVRTLSIINQTFPISATKQQIVTSENGCMFLSLSHHSIVWRAGWSTLTWGVITACFRSMESISSSRCQESQKRYTCNYIIIIKLEKVMIM